MNKFTGSVKNVTPNAQLTNVIITGLGPDSAGNWVTPNNHSISKTLYGNTLYICVQFIGTPNWGTVFFYENGNNIASSSINNYASNSDGSIRAYSIPVSALPSRNSNGYIGQISVKAQSNLGAMYGDYVNSFYLVQS